MGQSGEHIRITLELRLSDFEWLGSIAQESNESIEQFVIAGAFERAAAIGGGRRSSTKVRTVQVGEGKFAGRQLGRPAPAAAPSFPPPCRADHERCWEVGALITVLESAAKLYRDETRMIDFLARHHPMLDGRSPLAAALDRRDGADEVLQLIGRLASSSGV